MRKLVNESEAAEILGVSVHKLRKDRWNGRGIPHIKFPGDRGAVRYSIQAIDEYIAGHTQGSTSENKPQREVAK